VAAPLRGVSACQLDQPLLDIPLDLDLVRARGLRPAKEGDVQALGDQLLADAGDGPQAGPQGGDDLLIGAFVPAGIVGQKEDAGVGQFAGRGLAAGHQLFQVCPFLSRQSHPVLVHVGRPVLGMVPGAGHQESGYCCYLPNEDWRTTK
jgi:hypothetical protein